MYIMYRLNIYSDVLKYFMETWLFHKKQTKYKCKPLNRTVQKITQKSLKIVFLKNFYLSRKTEIYQIIKMWSVNSKICTFFM